jgi:hypothetical protein
MSTLSPAAQAVMDAFHEAANGDYVDGVWTPDLAAQVAAALRAAADQVVPEPAVVNRFGEDFDAGYQQADAETREHLLAIAAELEG